MNRRKAGAGGAVVEAAAAAAAVAAPAAIAPAAPLPTGRFGARGGARPAAAAKPAWVAAQWKHVVPESPPRGGPGGAEPAARRGGRAPSLRLVEHRRRAAAEYRTARELVAAILERCERLQAACAPPPPRRPATAPAAGGACCGGATRVTIRSGLSFSPPAGGGAAPSGPAPRGAAATGCPAAACGPAAVQSPPPPQPQPGPAPWCGAVDLNPGYTLPAGSPRRAAAAAPHLAEALARLEQLRAEVRRLDLGRLTSREALQAGVARLNADVYGALHEAHARAVPAAWG
ncbi:hypothetical protein Rsub_00570 [Raphidocelis subcapitata]|uniref:Uncharacterized protein n=1 Tax=Raphidocelis subcapitata TaxID=307507 RepID=A0A2V0NKL3_9CHLO|nr:hypothetical protein Rsub_00570 [Raphidocelis subcapitata]|eukprot:GBF87858.1 hypothetical protein Rsub_00570 [Raphidocelis subcapitata]